MPVLTSEQVAQAAASLWQAQQAGARRITPVSARFGQADVGDAYRIAQQVTEMRLGRGETVRGHKIGLTSKAMRAITRAQEPDYGTLTDSHFLGEGTVVPWTGLHRPLVEAEIAFVLKADLLNPGVNNADVIRATDFILPCLEIVDSRQEGNGPNPLVDTIADAASCGAVVLGSNPRRLDQVNLQCLGAILRRNGDVEESGMAAAVMGSPLNAVAWLANALSKLGTPLRAGQVVLSGSFLRALRVEPGDCIAAQFHDLGEVVVRFAHRSEPGT